MFRNCGWVLTLPVPGEDLFAMVDPAGRGMLTNPGPKIPAKGLGGADPGALAPGDDWVPVGVVLAAVLVPDWLVAWTEGPC